MLLSTKKATVAVTCLAVLVPVGALAAQSSTAQSNTGGFKMSAALNLADTNRIYGFVLNPEGELYDNVHVSAKVPSTGKVVSSAIPYGGEFALWVPDGKYKVTFDSQDEDVADQTLTLTVSRDLILEDIEMLYKAPVVSKAPRITGTAEYGNVLTAFPGTWNKEGVKFKYKWLRDGKVRAGYTRSTYTPVPEDVGHKLTVQVTTVLAGHEAAVVTSAARALAKGTTSSVVTVNRATLTPKQTLNVTVNVERVGPSPTGNVVIRDNGVKVATVPVRAGSAYKSFTGLTLGTHKFEATYVGSDLHKSSVSAVKKVVVVKKL